MHILVYSKKYIIAKMQLIKQEQQIPKDLKLNLYHFNNKFYCKS